jgi:uncharacterized protein YwqG
VSDRRGFFRELLREAVDVVQEVSSALQSVSEPDTWRPPPPVPAQPSTRLVDDDMLLALCSEAGLDQRAADVRRTARTGMRLTRAQSGGAELGRSRLGGSPDLPPGFVWPIWSGRELGFLGQIDLGAVAAVDGGTALPREGLLLFFYDVAAGPSGLSPAHRGSCRVVLVSARADELEADGRHAPALRTLPLAVSPELMLPGAWSFAAEELELAPDEMDKWDELRDRLARAQGVELEEKGPDRVALHRLLGYQDEVGREIELDCQLASAGVDAEDVSLYFESRADHEAEARTWRLLLQLSADDSLATPDGSFDRLFVCIREPDLRAGNLDEAWALLR